MKLAPPCNLKKRNIRTSKKIANDKMWVNYDILIIFFIYGGFGASSMILSLSLIITFCLTKSENKTKIFLIHPAYYCFCIIFAQKMLMSAKCAHVCVLTYRISSF